MIEPQLKFKLVAFLQPAAGLYHITDDIDVCCGQQTEPFVSVEMMKDHLILLALFNKVHHSIQQGGVLVDDATGLPVTTSSYLLFLTKAQHRFDLWISRILRNGNRYAGTPLQTKEIPPVDVLMFLHSYMLSPWNFYEDCCRLYPELSREPFPLAALRSLIDVDKMEFKPTKDQISHWESTTGTPFSHSPCDSDTSLLDISCPKCARPVNVAYVDKNDTGFGQSNFSALCIHCGLTITRDSLCVAKFFGDISNPNAVLANSLLNKSGNVDISAATSITQVVREAMGSPNVADGDKFGWDMSSIATTLRANLPGVELLERVNNIMKSYRHPYQTSLDLGGAVLRQARFIREMHSINWCGNPHSFEDDGSLDLAIARYHQYLALDPVSMTPALDIDLAFHTHQLQGSHFRKHSIQVLGRFLNHDDSFEQSAILKNLSYTQKGWEETYGTDYLTPLVFSCKNGCG